MRWEWSHQGSRAVSEIADFPIIGKGIGLLATKVASGGQKGIGEVFRETVRKTMKVKGNEAGWVDFDGVADSHKHIGDLSGVALSRLFESSGEDGYPCLCSATFSDWYCP